MPAYYIELGLVLLGIVLLMLDSFASKINKTTIGLIAALGIMGLLAALFCPALGCQSECQSPLLAMFDFDVNIRNYKAIILIATLLGTIMAIDNSALIKLLSGSSRSGEGSGEFYILPLFAAAGMCLMLSMNNLIGLFVALELVTITFYVMVGYLRRNVGSLEAGVKYLILGALSTGILVFGFAWLYGMLGSFDLQQYPALLANLDPQRQYGLLFALALIMLALLFKVGAVPMHIWVPDVYQGAPTSVSAMLSVASKTAGLFVLIKVLEPFMQVHELHKKLQLLLALATVATLIVGNFAALSQRNVKRLMGYSSVANAGFMLVFIANWREGLAARDIFDYVLLYLSAYVVMTFAAFYVLSIIRQQRGAEDLEAFAGLSKTNPALALFTTIIFASLAGLPLTIGFIGKLVVFINSAKNLNGLIGYGMFATLVITALLGFYYYFKVIRAIYIDKPESPQAAIKMPTLGLAVISTLVLIIVLIGLLPQFLLKLFSIQL